MQGNLKSGMQCAEFDLLLADALDGSLNGDQILRFENHKTVCSSCAALFAETQAGFDLLSTLDEVEPPRNLVHNILAATSGIREEAAASEMPVLPVMSAWQRFWLSVRPVFAPVFTPRFGGSLAMAFFSITLVLNVAGIKVAEVGKMDFSVRGVERTYFATRTRAIKYYENVRLVYEVETRVRNLRRAADTPENEDREKKDQPKRNDSNKNEPGQRENNYSRQEHTTILAQLDVKDLALREPARQRRTI
jgi:hypothetical protein